jgi:hypothetical protein
MTVKAEYVVIDRLTTRVVIADRWFYGSHLVVNLGETLDHLIPNANGGCPIRTISRGWQDASDKINADEIVVTITQLPQYRQLEIARSLGATPTGQYHWHLPGGLEADKRFRTAIGRAQGAMEARLLDLGPKLSQITVTWMRTIDDDCPWVREVTGT